jgi:hypothetical protein
LQLSVSSAASSQAALNGYQSVSVTHPEVRESADCAVAFINQMGSPASRGATLQKVVVAMEKNVGQSKRYNMRLDVATLGSAGTEQYLVRQK